MRPLNHQEQTLVSGGCGECKKATLDMLESCSMTQLRDVNKIFKGIILSDDMKGQSDDTIKAALITGIQNTQVLS